MIHFWLNRALVPTGIVEKFSAGYWGITLVALALQAAMIGLVFYLNRRHFARPAQPALVAAG